MSVEEMNKRTKAQPSAPTATPLPPPTAKAPPTPAPPIPPKAEEEPIKEVEEEQEKAETDVQWGVGGDPASDVSALEVEGRVMGSSEEGGNVQGAAEGTVHPCVPEETEEGEGMKEEEENKEETPSAEETEKRKEEEKNKEEKLEEERKRSKEEEELEGEKEKEELKEEEGEDGVKAEGGSEKEGKEKEGEMGNEGGGDKGEGGEEGEDGGASAEAMSHEKEEDAQDTPRKVESNCGGVGVPIDLSVGLLGADIDDRPKEETCAAFTTLPPEAPFSPPPRPKHLSCSYPSGTLKLSPQEIEEHPMSATFTIPNIGFNGKETEASSVSASSTAKQHGLIRHQKPSSQHREGRRSLVVRQGMQKQVSSSAAPSVQQKRSSSVSSLLFPETLPPCKNPKESLKQSFQSMDDPDWEVAMKGLETLVRLIRHHPSQVQSELTKVIATLARQIRNLRSQVARAACQASGELALPRVTPASPSSINSTDSISSSSSSLLRRALEADLEEVAAPLLHRSADTNRFLRDDCVAALDRFVSGVGPSRVVGPILSKGVTHQNALVRTVTARLLATIVSKLGAERVMTQLNKDVRAKVLRAGAQLLMEGSLQTRTFAKQVFRCLAGHENFDRCLAQAVPTPVLRNIHKTLISIKKESIASNGVDPTWDA